MSKELKKMAKELKYENDVSPNSEYQEIEIIKKNQREIQLLKSITNENFTSGP